MKKNEEKKNKKNLFATVNKWINKNLLERKSKSKLTDLISSLWFKILVPHKIAE